MWKSGLIIGIAALILAFATSAGLSPLCGLLCVSPLAGAVAGYLAGVFDKPVTGEGGAKSGAIGGAVAGAGAFLGQTLAGVVNAAFAPQIVQFSQRTFGLPGDVSTARLVSIGMGICGGLVDVVIMAGVGALGGYLWYRFTGSKATSVTPNEAPTL
jgi:hypothetical protein